MDTELTKYRVHQCSKCRGDTEYCCVTCPCDLCPRCRENHIKDLKTIDHNVVTHCDKFDYIQKEEYCVRHSNMHCEPCELSSCFYCPKDKDHITVNDISAYKTKRQHNRTIHTIKSEALFYRPILLQRAKSDLKTCLKGCSNLELEMLTKAQKMKALIDKVKTDFMFNVVFYFNFRHRCLNQKIKMSRHIVSLQRYVDRYEYQQSMRYNSSLP